MVRNAVTLNSTGEIIRIGFSDFENDGTFNASSETFHTNVLQTVEDIDVIPQKIVGSNPGIPTEMTQIEKDLVTSSIAADIRYLPMFFPLEPPETLTNDMDVISLLTYVSILDGNNIEMSLPNGDISLQTKRLQIQGTGNVDINMSLLSPNTKITMGNNSKAELFFRKDMKSTSGSFGVWCILDQKNITISV